MTAAHIRDLYEYAEWANGCIVASVSSLSQEQYTRVLVSSYPSIGETLAHTTYAEWLWLQRWKGESPASRPEWTRQPPVETLATALSAIAADRQKLLDSLDDAALEKPLAYRTTTGEPFSNRLVDVLLHVVNHTSYHRGQVVTMIRQVGGVPPNTDLIAFRRK